LPLIRAVEVLSSLQVTLSEPLRRFTRQGLGGCVVMVVIWMLNCPLAGLPAQLLAQLALPLALAGQPYTSVQKGGPPPLTLAVPERL
jgi:hypothetical protein